MEYLEKLPGFHRFQGDMLFAPIVQDVKPFSPFLPSLHIRPVHVQDLAAILNSWSQRSATEIWADLPHLFHVDPLAAPAKLLPPISVQEDL